MSDAKVKEVWYWYCRIDGEEGHASTRDKRDVLALAHRDERCETAGRPHKEWQEAGHLVHVWSW